MPGCSGCGRTIAKIEFSGVQLKKTAVLRRCRACVSGGVSTTDALKPPPLPTQSKKKVVSGRLCASAACGKPGASLICARCKGVVYCSTICQRLHWNKGGGNHKAHCHPAPRPGQPLHRTQLDSTVALAVAVASPATPEWLRPRPSVCSLLRAATAADREEDGGDPVNPCPVCIVREDDCGHRPGVCTECGRMYCNDCKDIMHMHDCLECAKGRHTRVENCPMCRAPFAVPDKVHAARLLKLLGRSPGRHTPLAQCELARLFIDGSGVARDVGKAVGLMRAAASSDHGCTAAQIELVHALLANPGLAQDDAETLRWAQLAARSGSAESQCVLSNLYSIAQDHAQAMHWGRLAAEQGLDVAQFNVGVMYDVWLSTDIPRPVALDFAEAARWYRLAAAQGLAEAECNLALLYKNGNVVPPGAGDVGDASRLAAQLLRRAAEKGNREAQCILGEAFFTGDVVPVNFNEAARWSRLAAAQGVVEAQCNLGMMYQLGNGVTTDITEAEHLYRQAAEQGHAESRFRLGVLYFTGTGVRQNDTEATRLFLLASDDGHAYAQFMLGSMYRGGYTGGHEHSVAQDFCKARHYFCLAADAGHAEAQSALGSMCRTGRPGVPKNVTEALRQWQRAVDQGHAEAMCHLGIEYAMGRIVPNDDAEFKRLCKLARDLGLKKCDTCYCTLVLSDDEAE